MSKKRTAPSAPQVAPATSILHLPHHLRDVAALTGDELCEHVLRVQKAALYKMIKRGDWPPPVKIGGRSLWLVADLDRLMNARVEAAAAVQLSRKAAA